MVSFRVDKESVVVNKTKKMEEFKIHEIENSLGKLDILLNRSIDLLEDATDVLAGASMPAQEISDRYRYR